MHRTQDSPVGGSSSSLAGANGTLDSRVDGGDSPEAHASFGASSLPSQVTQEQPEARTLGPQTTDSVDQCGWSDAFKKALEGTQLDLEDITLDEIVPGCPDNRVECVG